MVRIIILICISITVTNSFGQSKKRPYKCGYVSKDMEELTVNYQRFSKYLGVQEGETVASVGASNGYVEIQISIFVKNINWTIQDIDTTCLNSKELTNVVRYYEQLTSKKLEANIDIVIGSTSKTNLPRHHYDRILLVNVFHELTEREAIMKDIYESLKENGIVVIMERMGTKPGQKHGDCGLPKLWEPEFVNEMKKYGFELSNKIIPDKKFTLTYYTFTKK